MTATDRQTYTRHFNRYELKYLVHYEQAGEFLNLVGRYIERDVNAGPQGVYRICSLYFDSPELTAFWEKLDGVKFRRKVRLRKYLNDERDEVFLEIKQRTDRTVQKRRTRGRLGPLLSLMRRGRGCVARDDVTDEAIWLADTHRLSPKAITSYNREAYFGRFERGLRITFDKNVRGRLWRGRFGCDPRRDAFIVPPSMFVLEVKCNNTVPTWVCSALNSMNLQIWRFSKYCGVINRHVYGGDLL